MRATWVRFVSVLLAVLTAVGIASVAASATPTNSQYLAPNYETWVNNGAYGVRSDDFGGRTWLKATTAPGFNVRLSLGDNGGVVSFPNIWRGWQWGLGTKGGWPVQVRQDRTPKATLLTKQTWSGKYNTTLDMWFSTSPQKTGQANGAEVMVWLTHPGITLSGWPSVWVDGAKWYVMSWLAHNAWNYVAFVKASPSSNLRSAWLNPFFRYAENHGKLSPYWYWDNAEAGFEIWHGGTGLAISKFTVGN